LDVTIKVSIVIVFAFLLTRLLHRRSAALRHLVWSAALLSSCLLPLITLMVPKWGTASSILTLTLPTPPSVRAATVVTEAPAMAESATVSVAPAMMTTNLGVLLWCLGFVLAVALLCREASHLVAIAHRAQPFFDSRWRRTADDLCARFAMKRSVRFLQNRTES